MHNLLPKADSTALSAKKDIRLHYLDGVRGWAAFFVLIYHSANELFGEVIPSLRTTWLGVLNDGSLAVLVFFVLSGFVLSGPFLSTLDMQRIRLTAAGRYVRLTIPIAAASLLAFILMKMGVMNNYEASVIVHSDWLNQFYQFKPSLLSYFRFILSDVYFNYDLLTSYGAFLWPMSYELMGSFLIFAIIALFGTSGRLRIISSVVAVLLFWKLYSLLLTFSLGYLLANINTMVVGRNITKGIVGNIIGLAFFAIAMAMSIYFRRAGNRVDPFVAACVVAAPLFSSYLRALLSSSISAWLGRISFPLYLTHSVVICCLSSFMIIELHQLSWSFLASATAVIPSTIVVSLLVAQIFEPIERFSIRSARRFGTLVIRFGAQNAA
jgi:peptidoglycan/LPS O-acetylase OafA/YrhL